MSERVAGTNRKGRTSKEKILRAATTVFADHGYRGTTMADVAAAAGLTHPGLLYHYPRKEDLLFAVLDRHLVPGVTSVKQAAARGSEGVLSALVDIARENVADPEWIRLASGLMAEALAPSHPAHDYFRRRAELISSAMASGLTDLEPDHTRRLSMARVLNSAWDGLRMNALLDPSLDVIGDVELLVEWVRESSRGSVEARLATD